MERDCCCNAGLCSRVWKRGSDLRVICVHHWIPVNLLQGKESFNLDDCLQSKKGLFDEPLAKMTKLQRSAKSPSPEEASTSAPPILEAKNSER